MDWFVQKHTQAISGGNNIALKNVHLLILSSYVTVLLNLKKNFLREFIIYIVANTFRYQSCTK
jgi:hypothetical protein